MKVDPAIMLEHYRRDRNKLLQFILNSPNLIKQINTPSGPTTSLSDINLDTLSADYVLSCINSGGVVDVSEATSSYYRELTYPTMIHSQSGTSYFNVTESKVSGSPPNRQPPPVGGGKRTNVVPRSSTQADRILDRSTTSWKDERAFEAVNETSRPSKPADVGVVPQLGLPPLRTGLSDDDLRESAYEVLVASLVVSGIEVLGEQNRRKEKSSKLLSRLKSQKDREIIQPHPKDWNLELLNTIRTQMEVSEAMDSCIRQRLMRSSRAQPTQIDVVQIVLGLINSISRSSFQHEKSYIHWKNRQANILEELSCSGNLTAEGRTIKYSIDKVRNEKEWDIMSSTERAEILVSVRNFALKLSSKSEIGEESSHLAMCRHLKIRLYEKLLSSVFDILEEGQLLTEADEILKLIKLTWPTLGITQIIHEALWGWVLFKQYVQTDVEKLLEYATVQVRKVLEDESLFKTVKEGLICTVEWKGNTFQFNLVPAILLSMRIWCDRVLQDYHRCFAQKPSKFKRILTFATTAGVLDLNKQGELIISDNSTKNTSRRLKKYVECSVRAAYMQMVESLERKSNLEGMHPLALLASDLKLIAETEYTVFCPILHKWCPEAGMTSASVLYKLFVDRLRPFLQSVSSFSQDVKLVLSSARLLDQKLSQLYSFGSEESTLPVDLDHYQIGEVSGPLILDWVMSQHTYILDWIGRAFDLEEWEPLSSQQKQAVSVVEVFRMIEETTDQFFGLNLPVNITHLQALLSIVIHSLDGYVTKMIDHLVDKNLLYPSTPPLTRYEETLVAISRKKAFEPKILDEKSGATLNQLTIPKLCIRLNTLQYIRNHVSSLEDGLRKSWGQIRPSVKRSWFNIVDEETPEMGRIMSMNDESIDELFATTFDGIRNTVTDAINKIVDFIGMKVVFWDLREQFLFCLYRGGVEKARMEAVLPNVDAVLDNVCSLVDEVVRDTLVLSIFRASVEGYLWVLLDGGPSRAFSDSDITLMEDDLDILKDFFVADGEGLPRSMVEREAKFARQVISLFSLQTSTIIQMLMSASERISTGLEPRNHGHRSLDDANTLIRILCHKKDREASKFLRRHYQLPPSSEYEDNPGNESTSSPSFSSGSAAIISDLFKRSASFRFPETGHSSFKSLKKKFQDAW